MSVMSLAPVPKWMFPPEGGFTADDLDHLPDLPPHTELIDGSLILVSPQASFHMRVIDMLVATLRRTAPVDLLVRREMTITLDRTQRPEPDIIVIKAGAEKHDGQTTYRPDDVILVIEVVSPESQDRDRKRKPQLYAEAGIRHFWLIENERYRPILQTYMLDSLVPTYHQTGIHEGSFTLDVPYPIGIDFSEIKRM